ncbi:hypothetical protein [Nocardioides sp. AE5]|uniref:hypothetical protein n=1 Tax=Nocardioides sp. AE5 TaxID=2962573 RepID=UPI002881A29A|nr:hypothetical protein [Nocardioides sp. AE5]MDT0202529.1 hypothetical protein [Nocardioides sp. AE5]
MRSVVGAAAAALLLSGCATWSAYDGLDPREPEPRDPGSREELVKLPADDILDLLEGGLDALESVTMTMTTNEAGEEVPESITYELAADGRCRSVLAYPDFTATTVLDGALVWIAAPEEFYTLVGYPDQEVDLIVEMLGDHEWLLMDRSAVAPEDLLGPCPGLDDIRAIMLEDIDFLRSEIVWSPRFTKVAGQTVLQIRAADWSTDLEVYVEPDPPYRLLESHQYGDEEFHIVYSDFDVDFEWEPPAEGDYADFTAPPI